MDRSKLIRKVSNKLAEENEEFDIKLKKDLMSRLSVINENLKKTLELSEEYSKFLKDNQISFTLDKELDKYVSRIIDLTKRIEQKADKWDILHR